VIAVAGSNGKTSTKEMTGGDPKSKRVNCLATRGNLNNHIGVPLTLLRTRARASLRGVEMGANLAR
jgi:UDP-N-acetylmuramoyl-tripeptide--D-alanyl-D-alanine ligase